MKKKKPISFFRLIENLLQAYLERMVDLARLVRLEGQLARKTALQVLILYLVSIIVLGSTWLSFLGFLFLGLTALHVNTIIAAVIIVVLNIGLLVGIWFYITKIKEDMFFPATRKQLSSTHAKALKERALFYEPHQTKD